MKSSRIENIKNFEGLPTNLQMIYAVSKALNPNSKIQDYKKSAFFFEKIFLSNSYEKKSFPLHISCSTSNLM